VGVKIEDDMKFLAILITLVCPAQAALLANFQTTHGNVTVELQYDKAPQAVANFITLAQGTRSRIVQNTGAITKAPLYIGEKFFRVINDPTFKIAQTGSGTGNNGGTTGFTFRDEFDPTLTHVPYVLSMANSGPNSNSSQIFFTGNATIPNLNNVHTVFGLITDVPSRGVIDAIMAAGNNGTTITGVTFSRTDPAAVAFNEFGQNLPICMGVEGTLSANINVSITYALNTPLPAGSVLQAFSSTNLQAWGKFGEIYQGVGQSGASNVTLKIPTVSRPLPPREFYQLPLVTYPDALAPASLANRTLIMGLASGATYTFNFNAAGTGGSVVDSTNPSMPGVIAGVNYQPAPYSATWIIDAGAVGFFRFQCVLKTETPTHILGTNRSEKASDGFWVPLSNGSLSLTK
jgi:peptidyl-prolyl cis-trans isomerase A (cyclophilin A)